MSAPRQLLVRLASPRSGRSFTSTARLAVNEDPWPQKTPLGPFYESIIRDPTPYPFEQKPEDPPDSADPAVLPPDKKPEAPPALRPTKRKPGRKPAASASGPSPTSRSPSAVSTPMPSPPPSTAAERARIFFGSRLLGPAEQADRLAAKKAQSTYVAGVLVPPRPEEPDNCCMSGCVNCVWDRFRDDMEEWAAKKNEAQMRLDQGAGSMDADGGGSHAGWGLRLGNSKIAKDLWDEDVFDKIPVGILEFMKQEKRLKEKHQSQGTVGG